MYEKLHVLYCIPQNRMWGTSLDLFSFIYESSLHVQCLHHALRRPKKAASFSNDFNSFDCLFGDLDF